MRNSRVGIEPTASLKELVCRKRRMEKYPVPGKLQGKAGNPPGGKYSQVIKVIQGNDSQAIKAIDAI